MPLGNRSRRKDILQPFRIFYSLARRSACQSKEVDLHDAQIDLLTGMYNFVDEHRAFRQCINPNAKRVEVKHKQSSPAMLEGFTDHCLTLEELLMWRGPE